MDYRVIARRWRPKKFEDLIGQDAVVRTLRNAIELNRIAHAYIFVGPRGTGKTSTARLFAMALNGSREPSVEFDPNSKICTEIYSGNNIDVIEIDGASNNSVEQIRSLREECQYSPAQSSFKIYIIDEVHMLTTAAFNALLKTLEEPPSHVKFIFATTEADKVPTTIMSRCQRFQFNPLSEKDIFERLNYIAKEEKIEAEQNALRAISRLAKGGMRDAQSMLDQVVAYGNGTVSEKAVSEIYGIAPEKHILQLAESIENVDRKSALELIELIAKEGYDFLHALLDLQNYFRSKLIRKDESTLSASALVRVLEGLIESEKSVQKGLSMRINFEMAIFTAIQNACSKSIDSLINEISSMQGIAVGSVEEKSADVKKKFQIL